MIVKLSEEDKQFIISYYEKYGLLNVEKYLYEDMTVENYDALLDNLNDIETWIISDNYYFPTENSKRINRIYKEILDQREDLIKLQDYEYYAEIYG